MNLNINRANYTATINGRPYSWERNTSFDRRLAIEDFRTLEDIQRMGFFNGLVRDAEMYEWLFDRITGIINHSVKKDLLNELKKYYRKDMGLDHTKYNPKNNPIYGSGSKPYCGKNSKAPKGQRMGSMKECADIGQIRRYGLRQIDSRTLESITGTKGEKKYTKKDRDNMMIKYVKSSGKIKKLETKINDPSLKKQEKAEIKKELENEKKNQMELIQKVKMIDNKLSGKSEVVKPVVIKPKINPDEIMNMLIKQQKMLLDDKDSIVEQNMKLMKKLVGKGLSGGSKEWTNINNNPITEAQKIDTYEKLKIILYEFNKIMHQYNTRQERRNAIIHKFWDKNENDVQLLIDSFLINKIDLNWNEANNLMRDVSNEMLRANATIGELENIIPPDKILTEFPPLGWYPANA